MVPPLGLEPRTNGLKVHCSTIELERRDRRDSQGKPRWICCAELCVDIVGPANDRDDPDLVDLMLVAPLPAVLGCS